MYALSDKIIDLYYRTHTEGERERERERETSVTASAAKRSVRVRAYALANYYYVWGNYMNVSLRFLFRFLFLCGRHTCRRKKLEFFIKCQRGGLLPRPSLLWQKCVLLFKIQFNTSSFVKQTSSIYRFVDKTTNAIAMVAFETVFGPQFNLQWTLDIYNIWFRFHVTNSKITNSFQSTIFRSFFLVNGYFGRLKKNRLIS